METMISKTHAMAVRDVNSFNHDDGWFGTVYHLQTVDFDGHVHTLAPSDSDVYISIIHNRSDGTSRVYRTDGLGNQLNLDGTTPNIINTRTGFITEVSEQISDANILTVLFNAI